MPMSSKRKVNMLHDSGMFEKKSIILQFSWMWFLGFGFNAWIMSGNCTHSKSPSVHSVLIIWQNRKHTPHTNCNSSRSKHLRQHGLGFNISIHAFVILPQFIISCCSLLTMQWCKILKNKIKPLIWYTETHCTFLQGSRELRGNPELWLLV